MFFVLFSWTQWWSGVSPRLIRGSEERVAIHHAHLSLGATLFFFLVLFFLIWAIKPGDSFLSKLKNAFKDASATAVSLFLVSSLFLMLYGLSQAWSKGEHTPVFGVFNLPHFLDFSWSTSGYMHAALSSISIYLFMGIVFVYLYKRLIQYVQPGVAVTLLMVLHLLVALPKPPSLHPIAAFGEYVLTPFIYLTALSVYNWANNRKPVYGAVYLLLILFFLYLPYFAFKVLPPWHQPAAKEVVLVEPQQQFAPLRAADDIFESPESFAVAEDTTAWCRQCHSVTKGQPHLLGPNLAGVFNQQLGSKVDYGRYSSAMTEKGEAGVFWTRENLAKYLTDGQGFVPGNLMNQQTDLSDPEKLNQALDYLEYISTQ
jgi:cytochrome c